MPPESTGLPLRRFVYAASGVLTADKLRGNDDVPEFYLGLSAAGRRKSFREVKFYKRGKRWAF